MVQFLGWQYALQKVGKVYPDDGRISASWDSYLHWAKQPNGWATMSNFKNACNKKTENLAAVKMSDELYGWLTASFISAYKGSTFDVYQCKKHGKFPRSSSN